MDFRKTPAKTHRSRRTDALNSGDQGKAWCRTQRRSPVSRGQPKEQGFHPWMLAKD